MARLEFGGDLAASVFTVTGDTLTVPPMGTTVTFWNAPTAGSQYTDLLELDGVTPIPGGVVTLTNAGEFRRFLGPDGVERIWAQAGAGPRRIVGPTAGSYLTHAGGDARYVPLAGADAEYLTPDTAAATYATQATVATKANADAVPILEELLFSVRIGDVPVAPASTVYHTFVAPFPLRIASASLVGLSAVASSSTNYWTVRLRRYVASGVFDTFAQKDTRAQDGGEAFTATQDWNFDNVAFVTGQDFVKGNMLVVQFVPTGSPAQLTGMAMTVRYLPL